MWRRLGICVVLGLAVASPAVAPAAAPSLHFSTFITSDLPLGQAVWSGRDMLYVAENDGKIEASDGAGQNVRPFASFVQGGEEMRCVPAPAKPRYWPQGIYCHTPDNRILRLSLDGSSITPLAQLPATGNSDGAIAFDTVGRYGYGLLAATGGSSSSGGEVFAIRRSGKVDTIGSYPGPGGADEIVLAPAQFGSASGQVLISIDQDHVTGKVLAIDPHGKVQTLASGLGNGLNPTALIAPSPAKRASGLPAAGLYLADTNSKKVFFAPAAALKGYVGSVIVGTELTGELWLIRPKAAGGFQALSVKSDLPSQPYNFEGSTYIG
jgi:hypothetical protein